MSRMRTLVIVSTVLAATCLGGASMALASASAGNSPAAPPPATPAAVPAPLIMQNTFVPITPCRIIDTRGNGGGQLAADSTRDFVVRGYSGFGAQGGHTFGCDIPTSATAIMVSVSSVNIGGVGYFRAFPYGESVPNASIAHYQPGPITTTGGTMTLGPAGAGYDITIRAYDAPSSIVVDVTGYFAPQMAALVSIEGDLVFATPRVVQAVRWDTGLYNVTFDTDVSMCAFQVTPYSYNYAVAVGPTGGNPTVATVWIHDPDGPAASHNTSFFIQAVC